MTQQPEPNLQEQNLQESDLQEQDFQGQDQARLFPKEAMIASAVAGTGCYALFITAKQYDLQLAEQKVEEKLQILKGESAEVVQNPASPKAQDMFGSARDFVTEIDVQAGNLDRLKEANPVAELGFTGAAYAITMGLAIGYAFGSIKNILRERKEAKQAQQQKQRDALHIKIRDNYTDDPVSQSVPDRKNRLDF